MWSMVLLMGLGMAIDPARLGLAVVMLSRKRPMVNLFAFWLGGIVAAVAVAVAALVVIRDAALILIKSAGEVAQEVREATVIMSGGRLQIIIGLVMLFSAGRMIKKLRAQVGMPVLVGGSGLSTMTLEPPRPAGLLERMNARLQEMLNCDVAWPAFVVGLASSVPPLESVIALTFIMASGAGLVTQFSAFFAFVLIVLTVIEIPLVAYLAVPQRTERVMNRIQNWVRIYRRQMTLTIFLGVGCLFVYQGVAAL